MRPDSILVPERAVTELQGKNFVWVIGADNKATQRTVKVGQQIGENLLILEEPQSGRAHRGGGGAKGAGRHGGQADDRRPGGRGRQAAEGAPKPAKEGETKHGKE